MVMEIIEMVQDLSPNSFADEFNGPSRLSELKPDQRRAGISLCIVGFVLICLACSDLNMVLQYARTIYSYYVHIQLRKNQVVSLNHKILSSPQTI